ncbi:hypothetical protein [Desulfuromonas acetoxidans]|nr:hypothetical protein [Desulfuromonas acetoxidans]
MTETFIFTLVCRPKKKHRLVTEYNSAANAIGRHLAALLKTLNVICRPDALYTLEHAQNDKAHQFTYHITTKQTDHVDNIYVQFPELIYSITKRVLSAKYGSKGEPFKLSEEEQNQINTIIKKPLKDFQEKPISEHFSKMIRSLKIPLKTVEIEIFQGNSKSATNSNSEKPPLDLFCDSGQTSNHDNNDKITYEPYDEQISRIADDHIVEPEQHIIDLFAGYKSRLDAINVGGKIAENEVRLSFSPEALSNFCELCTTRLGSIEALIDVNPDENGYHKVIKIIES